MHSRTCSCGKRTFHHTTPSSHRPGRHQPQPQHTPHNPPSNIRLNPCAAGRGSGSTDNNNSWREPFDDTTRRALREAAEVLSEAQQLAQQQTLAELMSSWTADSATAATTTAGNNSSSSSSTADAQPPQLPQPPAAAAAAGGGDDSGCSQPQQASSAAALEAFWVESGLSSSQSLSLVQEMASDPQLSGTCCNTQVLSQKLSSLSRVLPGVDVVQLVLRRPQLLMVPSSSAVHILVTLVNTLPGCDVVDMVSRQPGLLLLDAAGLSQVLQAVVHKLMQLHPSHMERVVAGIIEENPELILRMPYYLGDNVRLLDDLPIEIQNMMVLGDHGVGYLYRYWNNRLQERSNQTQWDSGTSAA